MNKYDGFKSKYNGSGKKLGHTLLLILLHSGCTTVATQTWDGHPTSQAATDVTCGEVCSYDDYFQRAKCNEKNLHHVPSSDGCDRSVILELQDNHLRTISAERLLGYIDVKTLDLSNNDITVIPPGIFSDMESLTNVLIHNNYLTELQNATFTGTKLTKIFLQRNEIADIDETAFHGLEIVVEIYLSGNEIETLPITTFQGMGQLEHLDIDNNRLVELDASIFSDLIKLKSLTLNNNKLKKLPNGLFHGLISLKEVVLSHNELITIPSPENLGIISVKKFHLNDNNLNLPMSVLPYIKVTNETLYIGNNPFNCDCNFLMLREWYQNKSQEDFFGRSVRCYLNNFRYLVNESLPLICPSSDVTTALSPDQLFTSSNFPVRDNSTHPVVTPLVKLEYHKGNEKSQVFNVILSTTSIYSAISLTLIIIILLYKFFFDRKTKSADKVQNNVSP